MKDAALKEATNFELTRHTESLKESKITIFHRYSFNSSILNRQYTEFNIVSITEIIVNK